MVSFIAGKWYSTYLLVFAVVLSHGLAEDVHDNSGTTGLTRVPRQSPGTGSSACLVPPHPANGRWELHRRFCDPDEDCVIPQGLVVQVGTHLVFSCTYSFRLVGNENVYCTANGIWTEIPRCTRIKCSSLDTISRAMTRDRNNLTPIGDVEAGTEVKLVCRPGYTKNTMAFPFSKGETSYCLDDGKWEVEPMECLPVCGLTPTSSMKSSATDSNSVLPWHASLYVSDGNRKNLICGATIIRERILLTSALCVFDEETNLRTIDTEKLFAMTANTYVDYDSPLHDPRIVQKSTVRRVHMNCNFKGLEKDYAADIALLELQEPFVFSSTVGPACLDLTNDTEKLLKPGVQGRIVASTSNGMLQTLTLPFISKSQYNLDLAKEFEDQVPITGDKFAAGSTQGSGICGSGLVFKKNNRWQVMGILSTGYKNVDANGRRLCNRFSYSRYTRIATYIEWVFDNIDPLLFGERFQGCSLSRNAIGYAYVPDVSRFQTQRPQNDQFVCYAPPQPKNGEWRFHGHPCTNNMGCKIPQVTELKPGSLLVYSCSPGYRSNGNTDVFCRSSGKWSPIPDCIPVNCDPLNSLSTIATCTRFREFISCDSPVPAETQAVVSCRNGYRKDSVFVATRRETVTCTEKGKWQPDPIRCVPVCGVAINPQVPFAIDGVPAKVSDFPWHATLYKERTSSRGTSKDFQCGATIIQANFLLTAAHCVYDEVTKTTVDPEKLFVMTGNIFRDWDSSIHDFRVVRREQVKKVYKHSKYYGLAGNYVSDIALLELKKPFNFSGILLPACLEVEENNGRILEAGALGRVAGFGRTATGPSSGILQTVTAPYVPDSLCKTSKNALENEYLISNDKFCAGYNNGTAVCDGDSGGGLVFRKNDLWYVMGIVSVGIGVDLNNGERTCDRYSYTLYTQVTTYMPWIQDVIANSEQYQS